jgi:CRP/FNR family transcriptional regulator, cyclic AMP receptor protein
MVRDIDSTGWLRDAAPDFREALLAAAVPRHYDAGVVFWQAGNAGEGLLGIVGGEAGVLHMMARPDSPVLTIVGSGFWAGNGSLLDNVPLTMTLVARTAVEAVLVPRRKVLAILDEQPQHWREIGRMTLGHVNLSVTIAADLMIAKSRQRCAATLLRLASCRFAHLADTAKPIVATQDELAAMANMTRHTIGPILRQFADAGLIAQSYRTLSVTDAPALRTIADAD